MYIYIGNHGQMPILQENINVVYLRISRIDTEPKLLF